MASIFHHDIYSQIFMLLALLIWSQINTEISGKMNTKNGKHIPCIISEKVCAKLIPSKTTKVGGGGNGEIV